MKILSDADLLQKTKEAAIIEKAATLELLRYLHEVERRRLFAKRSYSSLFAFVVGELGYSEAEASVRINAMRLMFEVKEAQSAIENGTLSLTTASQLQRFFRTEKKNLNISYSAEQKGEITLLCENKSKRNVDVILTGLSPQREAFREIQKQKTSDFTELRFQVKQDTVEKIEEIRNLKGFLSLSQIFDSALSNYLSSLRKQTVSVACPEMHKHEGTSSRYIPANLKRFIHRRSHGRCEYTDKL